MNKYYLRMEGVNLDNFAYDTNDLSTIRGGSLILLYAVDKVKGEYTQLKSISTGASSGLFSFEATDEREAEDLRLKVESLLRTGKEKHATFVVDSVADGGDFVKAKETLIARNHLRQMRCPSFAIPGDSGKTVCEFDRLRPANKTITKGQKEQQASESVKVRHDFGKESKQDFYRKLTGIEGLPKFVNDFDELTKDPTKGNLHHKMAVIYIDGNNFGRFEKECKTPEALKTWDDDIKRHRKGMLKTLLEDMKNSSGWTTDEGKMRFETLLWGGDDLTWIVPAWKGWSTLEFFFNKSRNWVYGDRQLTHAAGIVFCHHNAPIHRITKLAKNLAELAKEENRMQDLVAYEVLESFDQAGISMNDLNELRRKRCPEAVEPKELLISGGSIEHALKNMSVLKKGFPKRQLHKIIKALPDGPEKVNELVGKIKLDERTNKACEELKDCFGKEGSFWLHAADLWDYIGQEG